MGDVVDLAERRDPEKPTGVPVGRIVELEHVGTVGSTRVSIVELPDADPGWVYVAVSAGLGSTCRGIFPARPRPDGGSARVVARAVLRALMVVLPDPAAVEPAVCRADEPRLHEWFVNSDPILAAADSACDPDGAA